MADKQPTASVRTGFTVHPSTHSEINVRFDGEGGLFIEQDQDVIYVPSIAVARFQRAVYGLGQVL